MSNYGGSHDFVIMKSSFRIPEMVTASETLALWIEKPLNHLNHNAGVKACKLYTGYEESTY